MYEPSPYEVKVCSSRQAIQILLGYSEKANGQAIGPLSLAGERTTVAILKATPLPRGVLPVFMDLAAIPSPSGDERAVADRVIAYLVELGIDVTEDDAGAEIDATAGNLLAHIPAVADQGVPIFLCAHLDTVPPEGPIRPVVEGGVVRNSARTILGADNKAAVAVVLEAVRRVLAEGREHAGIELLFTIKEETGSDGMKTFDTEALRAMVGFVFDHSGPVGKVVAAAPHHRTITAEFSGRAAHAGINPEDGRSAIRAAARAVSAAPSGRIDGETVFNVGSIGGGGTVNVVPDRCQVLAEARSRDRAGLERVVEQVSEAFALGAAECDCQVALEVEETYPGYRLLPNDLPMRLACEALRRCGFEPQLFDTNGGSDANILNARGRPCANLTSGMMNLHSVDEQVAVRDLETMVDVTLELVAAAVQSA